MSNKKHIQDLSLTVALAMVVAVCMAGCVSDGRIEIAGNGADVPVSFSAYTQGMVTRGASVYQDSIQKGIGVFAYAPYDASTAWEDLQLVTNLKGDKITRHYTHP